MLLATSVVLNHVCLVAGVSLQELKEWCETFQTTVSTLQNNMSGQGSGTLREPSRPGYM